MIAYLKTLSGLEVFNITLAVLAALAAFGSINLMKYVVGHIDVMQTIISTRKLGASWHRSLLAGFQSSETMSLACGFVTLSSGLCGQVLGQLTGTWQNGFDTLMYGGLLAILLSNRRNLAFVGDYKHAASLGITGLCWISFLVRSH